MFTLHEQRPNLNKLGAHFPTQGRSPATHAPSGHRSQEHFGCVACGHTANADVNAARVIKARGIAQLLTQLPAKPKKKTTRMLRRLTNQGGSERPPQVPVENVSAASSRESANGAVFCEAGNRHLGASASGGR